MQTRLFHQRKVSPTPEYLYGCGKYQTEIDGLKKENQPNLYKLNFSTCLIAEYLVFIFFYSSHNSAIIVLLS